MTILGVFILVLLWAVALVPPWLRNRSEGRPADSIVSFRQQLSVLQRTTPGARSVTPINAYRPIAGSSAPAPITAAMMSRRLVRKRRRDILFTLGAVAGTTLLLAVMAGGAMIWLHLLADALFGGYVYLLAQTQRIAAERHDKVRYLPGTGGAAPEPALLLRRSAN
ncbi:hypothetical protein BH20ACT2_BH20ACT2_21360 [soil metagenome]